MAYVLRKAAVDENGEAILNEQGRPVGTDFLTQPFGARKGFTAPAGTVVQWAEVALHKPAAALAMGRLVAGGFITPADLDAFKVQKAVLVRGVRTICELDKSYSAGLYEVIVAVARDNEVNMKRAYKLSRAHWQFAWRIFKWFGSTMGHGVISDSVLTDERYQAMVQESREEKARQYA